MSFVFFWTRFIPPRLHQDYGGQEERTHPRLCLRQEDAGDIGNFIFCDVRCQAISGQGLDLYERRRVRICSAKLVWPVETAN
jgi:hypothetical protein